MITADELAPWDIRRHFKKAHYWSFLRVASLGKENLQYALDYWYDHKWVDEPYGPRRSEYRTIVSVLELAVTFAEWKPLFPYLRAEDHFKVGDKVIALVRKDGSYSPAEFEVLEVDTAHRFTDHEYFGIDHIDIYLAKDPTKSDEKIRMWTVDGDLLRPEEWEYLKAHPFYARLWIQSLRNQGGTQRILAEALDMDID